MRTMEADDYQRVEQVLQQQLNAVDTNHLKGMSKGSSLQSALESLNSTRSSPENNRQASQDSDDDEFYSMGDYSSLPPLGQPPALNFSSHTGVMADHVNASASLGSERSSLTNVSLGGSSSILTAMSSPVKGNDCKV